MGSLKEKALGAEGYGHSNKLEHYLEQLKNVTKNSNGFMACCPAHNDQNPSLSIREDNGKILFKCFAGCEYKDIMKELEPFKKIVAEYIYENENKKPVYKKTRYEPKNFSFSHPNGNGTWKSGISGIKRILYKLPALISADEVFIVEGEKDADRLNSLGLVATTSPFGASTSPDPGKKWLDDFNSYFEKKTVRILPDQDDPGKIFGNYIGSKLYGVARELKIIHLPGLSEGGDISDWLDAGHTIEELKALVDQTQSFDPSKVTEFIPPEIEAMNKEYAVSRAGSSTVIIWEHTDPIFKRPTVDFVQVKDAELWFQNKKVSDGSSIFEYWLEHRKRREYLHIVFEPDCLTPGCYNLWRGWGVEPDPRGEEGCKLLLAHIRDVLCGGNLEHYKWFLAWMSQAIQKPGERPGSAIILKSPEGPGKDLFGQYFGKLYGEHFLHFNNKNRITGQFNEHLKNALMVFGDEVTFGGDHESSNILKSIITDETLAIEPKFKKVLFVRNHMRLILATNEDWVLPMGLDARRFFMPTVSGKYIGDNSYFQALVEEMKNGGPECLLYFLRQTSIENVDLRNPPKTEGLLEQKHLSFPPVQRFWYELLLSGEFLENQDDLKVDGDGSWTYVRKKAFYEAYQSAIKDAKDRYSKSQQLFWGAIRDVAPRESVTSEDMKMEFSQTIPNPDVEGGSRAIHKKERVAKFPSIEKCRSYFEEKIIRQKVNWPKKGEVIL